MKIMNQFTIKSLRMNLKRTVMTVAGIVLSVAMIMAVFGFALSFQDLVKRDTMRYAGNWHVAFHGVSEEFGNELAKEPIFSGHELEADENGTYSVQLRLKEPNRDIYTEMEEFAKDHAPNYEMEINTALLRAEGIFRDNSTIRALLGVIIVLLVVIMSGAVMVIGNAFYISSSERSKQFGMLMSVGATKKQIAAAVRFEGMFLALIAIPIGVLFGFLLQGGVLLIANNLLGDSFAENNLALRMVISPIAIAIAAVLSVVTIQLATWSPARKCARISAIEAIRQTDDIKLTPKQVKTSRLAKRIFGFEGTLASKTIKRNKKKYRTTVLSLSISIILFITSASFGQLLTASLEKVISTDYNVWIEIAGDDYELQERLAAEIKQLPDAQVSPSRALRSVTELSEEMFTSEMRKYLPAVAGAPETNVNLISVSQEVFQQLTESLNLKEDDFLSTQTKKGILINTSSVFFEGEDVEFTPYEIKMGTELALGVPEDSHWLAGLTKEASLTIGAEMSELKLKELEYNADSFDLNILVSNQVMESLITSGPKQDLQLRLGVQAEQPDAFSQAAEEILSKELPEDGFIVSNLDKEMQQARNIVTLVMLFIYGFIAMLSLIGITNIVTTISTSMALRRQEFAMLRSVGMTSQGISKMLNLESFFYGIKALLIGIPIGIGVSVLLFFSIAQKLAIDYVFPLPSIIISIIGVWILIFSTMHYAGKKQKELNIIEGLKGDLG